MTFLRKTAAIVLIAAFVLHQAPVMAYTMVPDFLCDLGKQYYAEGKKEEALHEFRNALAIDPNNEEALRYIELLSGKIEEPQSVADRLKDSQGKEAAMIKALDQYSQQAEQRIPEEARKAGFTVSQTAVRSASAPAAALARDKAQTVTVINLDENLKSMRMPIELMKGHTIILRGQIISRYLVTEPTVLKVEKTGQDELTLTSTDLGYTYLHVWDSRDRWTMEFLGVPPRPEGIPSLEDQLLYSQEKGRNFKFRYSLDYQQFDTGPSFGPLDRTSYSWSHWLQLNGPTPYGDLDAATSVQTNTVDTSMTYATIGLTNGTYEDFRDFNIRLIDYAPLISNLAFSSSSLRGAMFNSKAFDKTVDYTVFWGQEGGGKYWGLSPGLTKTRDSYLEGFEFNYKPVTNQLYSLSAFSGYGSDRDPNLNDAGYDFKTWLGFGPWNYRYEVAYDTKTFANLFSTAYQTTGLTINEELRDTDKDFKTLTGTGWRAGEIGSLTTATWIPFQQLTLNGRLDIFRDRLFPNPEKKNSINEDFSVDGSYTLDDTTTLRADYALQNEIQRASPLKSYNTGVGIYKSLGTSHHVSVYANYRRQEASYLNSTINDYTDDKVLLGVRFALIGDLYYYLSTEYNWLLAHTDGTRTNPWAVENGLDWSRQLFNSPFYGDFRLVYRYEDRTDSPVSFLSGEQYWEGSGEIDYRPTASFESYIQARLRDTLPNSGSGSRRLDLSLYAGMRYLWDTGFRWDPIGDIEGYVFKDDNQDGLRQTGEAPVSGVKVKVGTHETATDKDGYFYFANLKGQKATVAANPATLPAGTVMTTPQVQEINVGHGRVSTIYFGVSSRTEISGYIFDDRNGNGTLDGNEKPIKGVAVVLDNAKKAVTDGSGRYLFGKALPGKHSLKMAVDTLSPDYLPTVPVIADIDLTEGASYVYNIPCRKVAD
ncbi:MAG: SdrD B-like domain-containing protein [Deltaproteobacteria bacterium]